MLACSAEFHALLGAILANTGRAHPRNKQTLHWASSFAFVTPQFPGPQAQTPEPESSSSADGDPTMLKGQRSGIKLQHPRLSGSALASGTESQFTTGRLLGQHSARRDEDVKLILKTKPGDGAPNTTIPEVEGTTPAPEAGSEYRSKDVRTELRTGTAELKHTKFESKRCHFTNPDTPFRNVTPQNDSFNCGVFVLLFAEKLSVLAKTNTDPCSVVITADDVEMGRGKIRAALWDLVVPKTHTGIERSLSPLA
jgi:hypothetical protein